MARRTLLLIASILTAAAGTALVWVYVQSADSRAQADWRPVQILRLSPDAQAVPVGTAASTLAGSNLLQTVSVPAGLVPRGALAALTSVSTQSVRTTILPGQFVTTAQFEQVTPDVARRMLGVSVPLAAPNRAASLLHPDSHVAVYYVSEAGKTSTAYLLLRDVRVIEVAGKTSSGTTQGTDRGSAADVSLEVDADAGARLILASQTGTLYFAVLGEGASAAPPNSVGVSELLAGPVSVQTPAS